MKYNDYNTYDFLKDEDFRRWVYTPNKMDDLFWESWLNNNPEKAAKALEAKEILISIRFKEKSEDAFLYKNVLNEVFEERRPVRFQKKAKVISIVKYVEVIKYVAATLFLLSFVYVYWFRDVDTSLSKEKDIPTASFVTKKTLKGEKLNLSLKDGSKIKLNADTRLTLPTHFSDSVRVVNLENGEAFFEVARDTEKPFIVQSKDIEITVLGTAFNVNSYPSDNLLSIAVTEGRVAIMPIGSKQSIYLEPGEICYYYKDSGQIQKGLFNAEKLLAWRHDILLFEEAGVQEVITRLERWYGVSFTVKGKILNERSFNGKFNNAPLNTVMEAFGFSSAFNYEIKGKEVMIESKK